VTTEVELRALVALPVNSNGESRPISLLAPVALRTVIERSSSSSEIKAAPEVQVGVSWKHYHFYLM
jgi:hypothetical protein